MIKPKFSDNGFNKSDNNINFNYQDEVTNIG